MADNSRMKFLMLMKAIYQADRETPEDDDNSPNDGENSPENE